MARTAGKIVPREAREELWLDTMTFREVSATVNFRRPEPQLWGDLAVRIAQGRGTNNMLEVELKSTRAGLGDGSGSDAETVVLHADSFESLVAIHSALGSALDKAREVGWTSVVARRHGSDGDEKAKTLRMGA